MSKGAARCSLLQYLVPLKNDTSFSQGLSKLVTEHLFFLVSIVGYAQLEFYLNGEMTKAKGIFDVGMKRFGSNTDFVMQYIDFLDRLNDDRNVRSLFQRVIDETTAKLESEKRESNLGEPTPETREKLRLFFDRFVEFERSRGDLSALSRVEKRREEAFPERPELRADSLLSVATRYQFLGLSPCSDFELSLMGGSTSRKPGVGTLIAAQAEWERERDRLLEVDRLREKERQQERERALERERELAQLRARELEMEMSSSSSASHANATPSTTSTAPAARPAALPQAQGPPRQGAVASSSKPVRKRRRTYSVQLISSLPLCLILPPLLSSFFHFSSFFLFSFFLSLFFYSLKYWSRKLCISLVD